jgi:hypothetical protein
MDLYEFKLHSLTGKAQLVWEKGNLLAIRCTPERRICLYHLDKFFAEVWYDQALNRITNVRAFKSRTCLEPYLNQVDLLDINL